MFLEISPSVFSSSFTKGKIPVRLGHARVNRSMPELASHRNLDLGVIVRMVLF